MHIAVVSAMSSITQFAEQSENIRLTRALQ